MVTLTAMAHATPSAAPLHERIAWAWTDFVRRRNLPAAPLAASVLVLLYAGSAVIALAFGELEAFAGDIRWPASFLIVALSAYYLVKLPEAIDRLWTSLRSWLANSEAEVAALEASTRPVLARYFLSSALVWAAFIVYWSATNSWGKEFEHSALARILNAGYGVFLVYFTGAVVAFNSIGLWNLLKRIGQSVDFKSEFILRGGKKALQPFNQLLVGNLLFFLAVIILTGASTVPRSGEALRTADFVLWVVVAAFTAATSMNGALEREKSRELQRLREGLDTAAGLPDDATPAQVLRSMHRMQVLQQGLQRVEAFSPTLFDTRFAIQISLSVTAILIANILLRRVLEGLI